MPPKACKYMQSFKLGQDVEGIRVNACETCLAFQEVATVIADEENRVVSGPRV